MLNTNDIETFPVKYDDILDRIDQIDPVAYAKTRNFLSGSVSRLSPYISRGVISTKLVLSHLVEKGYHADRMEKFIQELAWRDYWQQVGINKKQAIHKDLKYAQNPVTNRAMPMAIVEARTGIEAVDKAIVTFYESGYLHNHMRMYIASIACNIGQSHWKVPSQWMYYHLLDADWASNALSWQWVAGTNSQKKYYANQENINKYCSSEQKGTFLDVTYGSFSKLDIPQILLDTKELALKTKLPEKQEISVNRELPTCVYNFYNLDPKWRENEKVNRVLLLEPSHFEQFPVSSKSIEFMLRLCENIENIQIFVGEFKDLIKMHHLEKLVSKEHPLFEHYSGLKDPRDWMFSVRGDYGSFFPFWKACKKELLPIELSL